MTASSSAEQLAIGIEDAIRAWDRERPRSKQTSDFVVGVSELGFCSERTRRMLAGITPKPTDNIAAFIGTALGDYIEQAICAKYPEAQRQLEVATELHGDQGTYTLTGHPDLIFPDWGLLDVKTTRGLEGVRRYGPNRQQQYQRHCYAFGAHDAGLFHPDLPLQDVQVGNVWFDRAGDDKGVHVQIERFNPEVVLEASYWLDEVVYAYLRGGEAAKEPPLNLCENYCGHFEDCRMGETDAEGLITDPAHLTAIEMYREGLTLESDGRRLKDQARAALQGVTGTNGKYALRWVWVNETVLPEQHRRGYHKLSMTRVR